MDGSDDDRKMNGVSSGGGASLPPFPQPEVIIDTVIGGKFEVNAEAFGHPNKVMDVC